MNIYDDRDGETTSVEVGSVGSWQEAGQRLANESGCVYVYDGERTTRVQDCECATRQAVCPGSPDGSRCDFREGVRVWTFLSFGEPPSARVDADIAANGMDPHDPEVFRPTLVVGGRASGR